MPDPEAAKKALQEFKMEDWAERVRAALDGLPPALREIGRDALKLRRAYYGYGEEGRKLAEAGRALDGLPESDRLALFGAFFPSLSPYPERLWQDGKRHLYGVGWERKAFRAPHDPGVTRPARIQRFVNLVSAIQGYDRDVRWLAEWGGYLSAFHTADALGTLLASAIDSGGEDGDAVFDTLLRSARGEHPVGVMGRHVTRALLTASRPDGWEFVERLLLSAQRQEGLRQVILETVDEAHPEAFRRMLRIMRDENLTRFSSVVYAADLWFGAGWTSMSPGAVNAALGRVLLYLDAPGARDEALRSGDGESAYFALWTLAFEDAVAATAPAAEMLRDPSLERRFAAAHLLGQLRLDKSLAALLPALEDPDLRVVASALKAYTMWKPEEQSQPFEGFFERLERAVNHLPQRETPLDPLIWPWTSGTVSRKEYLSVLIHHLGNRPATDLIPHLSHMEANDRYSVAELLAKQKMKDGPVREALFALLGDTSGYVRGSALKALSGHEIGGAEAIRIEGYLTRKAEDLRRGVLKLLVGQTDGAALASADRLLASRSDSQRLAGLEILRQLAEADRAFDACRERAGAYRSRPALTEEETRQLESILKVEREVPTKANAFGLADPAAGTPLAEPARREVVTRAPAAFAILASLDALIEGNRDTPVSWETEYGKREGLLGNLTWGFPGPKAGSPPGEDAARFPLREVWETWLRDRPVGLRDADGFELLRARALVCGAQEFRSPNWLRTDYKKLFDGKEHPPLRHPYLLATVLDWLLKLHPPEGAADFLLDAVETHFRDRIDSDLPLQGFVEAARAYRALCPDAWTAGQQLRFWRLLRWSVAYGKKGWANEYRPTLEETLRAYGPGGASDSDLFMTLLSEGQGYRGNLYAVSGRKPSPYEEKYPFLRPLVDRCRERILEVELARGEGSTEASPFAMQLRYSGGMDVFVRVLRALGKESFSRGYYYNAHSRSVVFSHLLRATHPGESDTYPAFAERVQAEKISEKRLVEAAVYAPQWASHVEQALGWPGLSSAVWWVHAHTKDEGWTVEQEVREAWAAEVNEYTPLSGQELLDGAVDVAWFRRAYGELGPERWAAVDDAAKYASGGQGHKRAQLFADAMRGRLDRAVLTARIREKRHQDSVRALGLAPLAEGADRDADVLGRYELFQEFLRGSRQFGAQKQASEKRAAAVGTANLARTAGYPDPIRLEWAMEARGIADLADGPLTLHAEGCDVSLSLDEFGQPAFTVMKEGKVLRNLPAALKKNAEVAALKKRAQEVKRQASRIKRSLEETMCRGDAFTGTELKGLLAHPLLAPMLSRLVLTGDGLAGYPAEGGGGLEDHSGRIHPVRAGDTLRIAHPHDLLESGEWHLWQRECFLRERIQSFKQVFRELYVLNPAEQGEDGNSCRYAGHQVNPRQALALLGGRGWVHHPEEGMRRTFHEENLTAWIEFEEGFFTPAEVEGLTLDGVCFSQKGEWKPIPLERVPPRIFSEVMRDLDLVVSVAHQGGVDPEATASTVEMRASLVREAARMLRLDNVRVEGKHAFIQGELGRYTVHLGSAVVHRQPGGHLCIVAVPSQHRGRLFLPFADDDPKTAEALSKVLLLARDTEIKDPNILDQIYGR